MGCWFVLAISLLNHTTSTGIRCNIRDREGVPGRSIDLISVVTYDGWHLLALPTLAVCGLRLCRDVL